MDVIRKVILPKIPFTLRFRKKSTQPAYLSEEKFLPLPYFPIYKVAFFLNGMDGTGQMLES